MPWHSHQLSAPYRAAQGVGKSLQSVYACYTLALWFEKNPSEREKMKKCPIDSRECDGCNGLRDPCSDAIESCLTERKAEVRVYTPFTQILNLTRGERSVRSRFARAL